MDSNIAPPETTPSADQWLLPEDRRALVSETNHEPGLQQTVHEDAVAYYGTREALVAACLAPADMSFAVQPGKRGVRFVNAAGRRVVIAKHGLGTYRLTEYLTKTEVSAKRCAERENEEARNAERQTALDRKEEERGSRATAGDVREYYLYGLKLIEKLAQRETPFIGCQFNYSAETREQMMNLVRQIDTLIRTAAMLPLRRPSGSRGHLRLAWTAEA